MSIVTTYKYSKWVKVFSMILCGLSLAAYIYYVIYEPGEENRTSIFILVFFVVMLIATYDSFKYKVEVTDSKILSYGLLRTKQLDLSNISSISRSKGYLFFYSSIKNSKHIAIPTYLSNYSELSEWAHSKYPDKDEQDYISDYQEIMLNKAFGIDEEERAQNLLEARRKAKILNTIAWVVGGWGFFYPHPYELSIIALAIIPLAGVLLIFTTNGLVAILDTSEEGKEGAYPSVMTAIIIPSIILGLRAMMDVNIYNYSWTIELCLILSIILAFLTTAVSKYKNNTEKYLFFFVLMLVFGSYSYGAVILYNTTLDTSNKVVYSTLIINKHITSGKIDTYHLILKPWGPTLIETDTEVSYTAYNQAEIGDTVPILYSEGFLGISWYKIPEF